MRTARSRNSSEYFLGADHWTILRWVQCLHQSRGGSNLPLSGVIDSVSAAGEGPAVVVGHVEVVVVAAGGDEVAGAIALAARSGDHCAVAVVAVVDMTGGDELIAEARLRAWAASLMATDTAAGRPARYATAVSVATCVPNSSTVGWRPTSLRSSSSNAAAGLRAAPCRVRRRAQGGRNRGRPQCRARRGSPRCARICG